MATPAAEAAAAAQKVGAPADVTACPAVGRCASARPSAIWARPGQHEPGTAASTAAATIATPTAAAARGLSQLPEAEARLVSKTGPTALRRYNTTLATDRPEADHDRARLDARVSTGGLRSSHS